MSEQNLDRWTGWRPRVGIALLVVALFLPSLWFTQSGYDDQWLWADDSPLRHVDGDMLHHVWLELGAHARHDVGTEYLPVRDMLTAADMAVWGNGYRGPHATQLVLYVLSVLALGGMLIRWGVRRDIAWIGTLIWAVHPLHVEAVGWLSERKGILAGLFSVALGHAWIRFRSDRSRAWLAAAVVCAVCATWSKAPAMFAPAVFAVWDLLLLSPNRRRAIIIFTVGIATALAAIPVFLVARGGGVVDSAVELAHDPRLVAAVGGLGHYTLGFIAVREPSLAYPLQTDGASGVDLAVGAVAVGLAVALFVVRRWPALAWRRAWVGWAAVLYFPISHLATRIHIPVADRYVYMLLLAPCIGVAALLGHLRGVVRLAAIGALTAALCILSIRAERAWTGRTQLWDHAFATNPRDVKACQNLVETLVFYTQFPEAIAVVDACLDARSDDPYLYGLRATVLDAMRLPEAALADSARAAASGHASMMFDHAGRLGAVGRLTEALPFAERAAQKRPEEVQYTWRYIGALTELKRYADAERVAFDLERRFPSPASEMVIARVYAAWRRLDHAELHLTTARLLGAYRSAVQSVREAMYAPFAPVAFPFGPIDD
ncbi:tetratricopeptide repeat protein [soil metagenome]